MFNISKIRPKSLFGPVKAQKFSRCLGDKPYMPITIYEMPQDVTGVSLLMGHWIPIGITHK